MSVRPSLRISETSEPIGFFSSGNMPTGPVVFSWGMGHPKPPEKKKFPPF